MAADGAASVASPVLSALEQVLSQNDVSKPCVRESCCILEPFFCHVREKKRPQHFKYCQNISAFEKVEMKISVVYK